MIEEITCFSREKKKQQRFSTATSLTTLITELCFSTLTASYPPMDTRSSLILVAALFIPSVVITKTSQTCSKMSSKLCNSSDITGISVAEINATMSMMNTLPLEKTCSVAMEDLLCSHAVQGCNIEVNLTRERCKVIQDNCSELAAMIFASTLCPSIPSYDENSCISVTVKAGGYCPNTTSYKIRAMDVKTFLAKIIEKKTSSLINGTKGCIESYRRIHCLSFVASCHEENNRTNLVTKESCLDDLGCLNRSIDANKTALCSNFSSEQAPTQTLDNTDTDQNDIVSSTIATAKPTTLSLANAIKTRAFFKLQQRKYDKNYANKTNPSSLQLTEDLTDALKKVYSGLAGFVTVQIAEYSNCNGLVVVLHDILTTAQTGTVDLEIIKAMLTIANKDGFLKDKVADINQKCHGDHDEDHAHNHDTNNWVYMIVFVCTTALLLLIMVLCNQSSY